MTWYLDDHLKRCRHIILKDIRRQVFIGAYDREKLAPQEVLFNIEVFVHTDNEGDCLDRAYNYDTIISAIDHALEAQPIQLQETVIDSIVRNLFRDHRVQAALVKSEKTQAYADAASAAVEIFRINPLSVAQYEA
ncbi:MAG TPA: dihydroneopterin aldolase [Candidatus Aphodousia gallistercoris]|nr:dihydroneopterin aldolase [Candidatus Aphodousia gallistercoris]